MHRERLLHAVGVEHHRLRCLQRIARHALQQERAGPADFEERVVTLARSKSYDVDGDVSLQRIAVGVRDEQLVPGERDVTRRRRARVDEPQAHAIAGAHRERLSVGINRAVDAGCRVRDLVAHRNARHFSHFGRIHRLRHRSGARTSLRRFQRTRPRNIVEGEHELPVNAFVSGIVDDDDAKEAACKSEAETVVVVPARTGRIRDEIVAIRAAVAHRFLRNAGHAVHVVGKQHAVPVDARRNVNEAGVVHPDSLSVHHAQQRSGDRAVIR